MKNKIIVVFCLCVLLTGCSSEMSDVTNAATEDTVSETIDNLDVSDEVTENIDVKYDLRNVNWGMSLQDVINSEEQTYTYISEDKQQIMYSDVTAGNVNFTYLMYYFDNDALNHAIYYADNTHSSDNLYVEDYNSLKDKLTSLYGTPNPNDVKEIWYDDLYKDNPNDYGKAVARGDLTMATRWTTDTTIITLFLSGDNYECKLAIQYYDVNKNMDTNSTDGL